MELLYNAAFELQTKLLQENWKFCFIGGLVIQAWGNPRLTRDIDLSLLTGFGNEEHYIIKLSTIVPPRIKDYLNHSIYQRVYLGLLPNGPEVDIGLAGFPYEEMIYERSRNVEMLPGISLRICSAEDLVVMKAFAYRPIDWKDVEGVLLRQFGKLDWDYIWTHLRPLATIKENPEIITQLEHLKQLVDIA